MFRTGMREASGRASIRQVSRWGMGGGGIRFPDGIKGGSWEGRHQGGGGGPKKKKRVS